MANASEMANAQDVRRLLGDLDDTVVSEVIKLQPTIADLEEAAQWIAGDRDLDQPEGQVLKGIAGEIVTLVAIDEDDGRGET